MICITALVALTGKREAYYTDYTGSPQEPSPRKRGSLPGPAPKWQRRRGTPAIDLPPACFVGFIENHDQVANTAHGWRLHRLTSPGRYRAMTAYLLLGPGTPMLFQGQEFASSAPFLYFADHRGELGAKVREGRAAFLAQFPSIATGDDGNLAGSDFPAPSSSTAQFRRAASPRASTAASRPPAIAAPRSRHERPAPRGVDGAVLGPELSSYGSSASRADRLLVVNLGADLAINPAPEPLLASPAEPAGRRRRQQHGYGGAGIAPVETRQNWHIPGHAAVLLEPQPAAGADDPAAGEPGDTE
jgi:maltooligosyltrehalose trehalohydrolase